MEKKILQPLEKRLNLIDPEQEEETYILTEQEEKTVIEHEISLLQKHKHWKYEEAGFSDEEIKLRLSRINFEEEIDKEDILKRANSRKHYEIWQKEQRIKDAEISKIQQDELQQRCHANYMFNVMAWTAKNEIGKDLIIHDSNRNLIKALCFFLSNDKRFEEIKGEDGYMYSFKKGLLIRGVSGLGKTFLVKCLENNELNPVLILSMIEISESIKEDGEFNIDMQDKKVVYLDDVGTEEPTVTHFGTKINYFKNFIETVYLKNKRFNKLMISTNNSFREIEEKYGFRVRSRMKDMFNIIDVNGSDMRGI